MVLGRDWCRVILRILARFRELRPSRLPVHIASFLNNNHKRGHNNVGRYKIHISSSVPEEKHWSCIHSSKSGTCMIGGISREAKEWDRLICKVGVLDGGSAALLKQMRKREIKFPSPVHKFSGPVSHYADGRMQQSRPCSCQLWGSPNPPSAGAEDTVFNALKTPPSHRIHFGRV